MKPQNLILNRRSMLLGGTALAALAACSKAEAPAAVATDTTLVSPTYGQIRGV